MNIELNDADRIYDKSKCEEQEPKRVDTSYFTCGFLQGHSNGIIISRAHKN